MVTCRKSLPEVFLRKSVLKICSKSTEEQPCRSVISIKLLCNFVEIALWHAWYSPVDLLHIFRTHFSKNTSGWLLLYLQIFVFSPNTKNYRPKNPLNFDTFQALVSFLTNYRLWKCAYNQETELRRAEAEI